MAPVIPAVPVIDPVTAFTYGLAGSFTDPVFLIAGAILLFFVKSWKFIWVFPAFGLLYSVAFGAMGGYDPAVVHVAAVVVAMSLLGMFGMLGKEYLGSGFNH